MEDNKPTNIPAPDQKPLPPSESSGFSKELMVIVVLIVVALGLVLFKMKSSHDVKVVRTPIEQAAMAHLTGLLVGEYCKEEYIKEIVRDHPKYPATVADCNALYKKIVNVCYDEVRRQAPGPITEANKDNFSAMLTNCIASTINNYK